MSCHPARRRPLRPTTVPAVCLLAAGFTLGPSLAPGLAATSGEVTLASHTPSGPATTGNGQSAFSATSGDGAYVAFASAATGLVPGQTDANGAQDVFLFERATGVVTLVSHIPGSATTTASQASGFPRLSADGAFVLFHSYAADLVEGQTGAPGNVFLFERATGRVTLVSHTASSPSVAAGDCYQIAAISADGAYVAFESYAADLVPGQDEAVSGVSNDIFLFERATGQLTLVSHVPGSPTTTAGNVYDSPSISADGARVAFASGAGNLVEGQVDNPFFSGDVFLFDRPTGGVALVSHVPGSPQTSANAPSGNPTVSANGGFVVFESSATDLVDSTSDDNGTFDLFLFDGASGAVSLVSHTPGSTTRTGDNSSHGAAEISADGGRVAFMSFATNLVAGQVDSNVNDDVFVYQRATGAVTLVSHTLASTVTTGDGVSHYPSLSTDGAAVAFMSEATNLVQGQKDGRWPTTDIFLSELTGKAATKLVSHAAKRPTTTANDSSGLRPGGRGPEIDAPKISRDGRAVAFVSLATDLVPNQADANGAVDAFVFWRG